MTACLIDEVFLKKFLRVKECLVLQKIMHCSPALNAQFVVVWINSNMVKYEQNFFCDKRTFLTCVRGLWSTVYVNTKQLSVYASQ